MSQRNGGANDGDEGCRNSFSAWGWMFLYSLWRAATLVNQREDTRQKGQQYRVEQYALEAFHLFRIV